ncbi:MAG: hypothetical protein IPG66_15910 [Hydrogenophilales bacterium]|nr:hypothetical protein [Hydrogenophilales bacterium]
MNMKRKLLSLAVLSTVGVAGTASAGFLSETGTGQVLIYPYYTVQNGFDTYINVTNTTGSPKAVKVRFREAKNSAEVLDFNLYLSPYDVWAGVITADGTDGARIKTADTSCTVPAIPTEGEPFRNLYYTGQAFGQTDDDNDDAEDDLNRVREGYVEIIEMGVPQHIDIDMTSATVYFDTAIKHTGTGASRKPGNCAAIVAAWDTAVGDGSDSIFTSLTNELSAPVGGLMGQGTLINVAQGTDYGYDPVVVESWASSDPDYRIDLGDYVGDDLHSFPGDLSPSIANGVPIAAVLMAASPVPTTIASGYGPSVPYGNASPGAQAMSAILMHSALMNTYNVEASLASGTDWVVTFPTKSEYVKADSADLPFNIREPFDNGNSVNGDTTGACQRTNLKIVDREEQEQSGSVNFSPRPRGSTFSLCWEANVLTFNNSNVLGSEKVNTNIPVPYNNGWVKLSWPVVTGAWVDDEWTANGGVTVDILQNLIMNGPSFVGLPAVGFAVQEYVNGNVGGSLSNYGGEWIHKYERELYMD